MEDNHGGCGVSETWSGDLTYGVFMAEESGGNPMVQGCWMWNLHLSLDENGGAWYLCWAVV